MLRSVLVFCILTLVLGCSSTLEVVDDDVRTGGVVMEGSGIMGSADQGDGMVGGYE